MLVPILLAVATGPLAAPAPLPPVACLWDRDTLKAEVAGKEALLHVLVGRFDRYPARYYEMRLARVAAELEETPLELGLYDDAGVACDRLGRQDEAIGWMERKERTLDRLRAEQPEPDRHLDHHAYTHLANLGTFHVHRWLKERGREDLADVRRARELIAAAIELNPRAHFGRERYQLLAIDALLEPPVAREGLEEPTFLSRAVGETIRARFSGKVLEEKGYGDAVEGIAGLVRLGAAWEAPSIWMALEQALLARHDSSLARLASLRVVELADAGRPPFPGFDRERQLDEFRATLHDDQLDRLDRWYARSRRSVERWRAARLAYMAERFDMGQHPDTHPGFWDAWEDEHPLPAPLGKGLLDGLVGR